MFDENAICPRSSSARACCSSSGEPASATGSSLSASRTRRHTVRLRGGKRPVHPPRWGPPSMRSDAPETPPRRPAHRAPAPGLPSARAPRHLLVGRGRGRARCQARRSGSSSGSVASASARWTRGAPAAGGPVDRRANQRVAEHHAGERVNSPSDSTVSAADSGIPSRSSRAPHQRRIADRVGCRHQQQTPRIPGSLASRRA